MLLKQVIFKGVESLVRFTKTWPLQVHVLSSPLSRTVFLVSYSSLGATYQTSLSLKYKAFIADMA